MDRSILCLFTKHFTVVDWTWLENGAQVYDYCFFQQQKESVCSQAEDNRQKTVTAKDYFSLRMWKTSFFVRSDCSAFWSPLPPLWPWHEWCMLVCVCVCVCVCVSLGMMPSLLGTASWGHCSFCLPASLWCFSYLFRRRSAVCWSCVPLTLRKMKDSHHRGYCTQYSNIKISQTQNLCPRDKDMKEGRWHFTVYIYTYICFYISNHIITAITCGLLPQTSTFEAACAIRVLLTFHKSHYIVFVNSFYIWQE